MSNTILNRATLGRATSGRATSGRATPVPTKPAINVTALLDDLARSFAPIAQQRGIRLVATPSASQPLWVSTSLEDVLPIFSLFWLKLLYLLPAGSRFEVMARLVERDEQTWLRLQITTERLNMNPNLLLPDSLKMLWLDTSQPNSSIIYIDLLLDEQPEPDPIAAVRPAMPLSEILDSEKLATTTKHRIESFMHDGLSLYKVQASANVQEAHFLETVGQFITTNLGNTAFDSEQLAREMGLSRSQLFRKLKKLTGFSTANYIRHVRLCYARNLLETTALPIGEVAGRVGFPELSYFSHAFAEAFGQTPSDWRKKTRMQQ